MTRTLGANARASDFVRQFSAALLAAYGIELPKPDWPATEVTFTMLPPRSCKAGSAARQQ